MAKFKGNITKLSDEVFSITCVHCGATEDIQVFPHRNTSGKMVGLIFACVKCIAYIQKATITLEEKVGE